MQYIENEIKKGITSHFIKTEKFKTNLVACFFTLPLDRKTITYNAMIPAILRRGTLKIPTMRELSIKLEEMYGSSFDCGVEKRGDNLVIKFYIECVNEKYLNTNEEILKDAISLLCEIMFNPFIENGTFKKEYIETEKQTLKQLIEGKIDNKDVYALTKAIEAMFKNNPYSIYKYGYVEDLEDINERNLYEYYKNMISTAKIDFFVLGNIDEIKINDLLKQKMGNINERNFKITLSEEKINNIPNNVFEKMDLQQAKLVIGLKTKINVDNFKAVASIYNTVLGGSSNSKLFRNVREKESLAYSIGSMFVYPKKTFFIRGGIELSKIEKAIEIIKVQLEDIKNGNFTDEELDDAKKYTINSLISIKDSGSPMIDYYMSFVLFDSELKTIDEYIENIKSVSKQDVINLAKSVRNRYNIFVIAKTSVKEA